MKDRKKARFCPLCKGELIMVYGQFTCKTEGCKNRGVETRGVTNAKL